MTFPARWTGHPPLPPEPERAVAALVPLFERRGVLLAYLFGSLAEGRPANDVDLAVLTRGAPAFRLRDEIIRCLGTDRLDLVDLRTASPVLRFAIISTGRLLYAVSDSTRHRFEQETLRLYRETAPVRRRQREYMKERMHRWALEGRSPMVFRREAVEERLRELAEILQELEVDRDLAWESFRDDRRERWIIERGLIAAAEVIFDTANHILSGYFGTYPETYQESLELLREKGVISGTLAGELRGLAGFRNILVHGYLEIDPRLVFEHFKESLETFPRFADEVLAWLDRLDA